MSPRAVDTARGIRRLGFGVSGPHGSGLVSPEKTRKLIVRAYELGIRLFDTAPAYGNGEAERRLGDAMARLPNLDCIISTKFGLYSKGAIGKQRDFSPDRLHRSIDESLKNLGLNRIDWLFLHGPAPHELNDALLQALEKEQFNGRIGLIGVTGRGEEIDAALQSDMFKLAMMPVHPLLDQASLERVARISQSGLELIAIETVAPTLSAPVIPTNAGSLWRFARNVVGRGSTHTTDLSPRESLEWALNTAASHRVLTTTTRMTHLEENAQTVISCSPDA